jgi:hypothetical protein
MAHRPLMRHPSGIYRRPTGLADLIQMEKSGWVQHPPPDPNKGLK